MTTKEKNQAVRDHGGLATSLGRKYHRSFPDFMDCDDWVGEAYVGMTFALNDFKQNAGRTLPSYIHLCIDRYLQKKVKHLLREKRNITNKEHIPFETGVYLDYESDYEDSIDAHYLTICYHTMEMLYQVELSHIKEHLSKAEMELLLWVLKKQSIASYSRMMGIDRRTGSLRFSKIKNKIENIIDKGIYHW